MGDFKEDTLTFKDHVNNWSAKKDELKQDDQKYKDQVEAPATTISDLLNKYGWLIGTFDIESTLLNGAMAWSSIAKHNTANPGAIALIRFLKEKKDDKYRSSIASIADVETFDANKLLDLLHNLKNHCFC